MKIKTYNEEHRKAPKRAGLADVDKALSGFSEDAPERISGVSVMVKAFLGLKNPKTSAMIPPPQADKVPQRIQVTTEAAILSLFT